MAAPVTFGATLRCWARSRRLRRQGAKEFRAHARPQPSFTAPLVRPPRWILSIRGICGETGPDGGDGAVRPLLRGSDDLSARNMWVMASGVRGEGRKGHMRLRL